jgi:hypothetical protein
MRLAPVQVDPVEVSDKLAEIYRLQVALLDDLYGYQREHYPSVPTIISILLGAVSKWREVYSEYSQLLFPAPLGTNPPSLLGDATTTPQLRGILASPFDHLRGVLRHVKALLDRTTDQHTDIEPIKALIQGLTALIKDSYRAFGSMKVVDNIESLKDLLSWNSGAPPVRFSLQRINR